MYYKMQILIHAITMRSNNWLSAHIKCFEDGEVRVETLPVKRFWCIGFESFFCEDFIACCWLGSYMQAGWGAAAQGMVKPKLENNFSL